MPGAQRVRLGRGFHAPAARYADREDVHVSTPQRGPNAELDEQPLELAATLFFDGNEEQDLTALAGVAGAAGGEEAQAVVALPAPEIAAHHGLAVHEPATHRAETRDLRGRRAYAVS